MIHSFETRLSPKTIDQLRVSRKLLVSRNGQYLACVLDETDRGFLMQRSKEKEAYIRGLTQPKLLEVGSEADFHGVTFWAQGTEGRTSGIYYLPHTSDRPFLQVQLDFFEGVRAGSPQVVMGRNDDDLPESVRYVVNQGNVVLTRRADFVAFYSDGAADVTIRGHDNWLAKFYTDPKKPVPLIELPYQDEIVRAVRIGGKHAYLISNDQVSRIQIGREVHDLGGPMESLWTSPDGSTVAVSTVENVTDQERGRQRKLFLLGLEQGHLKLWERKKGFWEISPGGLVWSQTGQSFAVQARCFSIDFDQRPSEEHRIISCEHPDVHSLPVPPRELSVSDQTPPAFVIDIHGKSLVCLGRTKLAEYDFAWNIRFEEQGQVVAFNAIDSENVHNIALNVAQETP